MIKTLLLGLILLFTMSLGPNLSASNDKIEKVLPDLNESQGIGNDNGFLSNDLPSSKGLVKSFIIVIGLMVIFFAFLRWRYGFSRGLKGSKKYIQVIEYSMLGPKRYLYLVKIIDKVLVIGATGEGLSLLCEINETEGKELIVNPNPKESGFSNLINKISPRE